MGRSAGVSARCADASAQSAPTGGRSGRSELQSPVGPYGPGAYMPVGVAHDVAARRSDRARPARAGFLLGDRVEAFAVDDHERVFGVRVDRDVLARPGFAVGLQLGGVLGRAEQAAAVQRVGDRARAVIAGGLERAVAAAEHVGPWWRFHRRRRSRARRRSSLRRSSCSTIRRSEELLRERRVGRLERLWL